MIELTQAPPMDEVWLVDGIYYAVRYVDRTNPPIPIVWEVRGDDIDGLGVRNKVTRRLSRSDFNKTGALTQGTARELVNTTEDPLEVLYSNYATEVRVKPWLADPEILSIWSAAALEGRSITDAELQGTEWWRSNSPAERQWLSLNAADPASADQLIADNRLQVRRLFERAGISNATDQLIQTVADLWTKGSWSEVYAVNQIDLLADPNLEGTLDLLLTKVAPSLDTTRQGEEEVRDMIQDWLGPAAAKDWSQDHVDKWASRFRQDPDARIEFEDTLRKHRLALFPEYKNANLTYEDIATPWRGVWASVMGEVADETDGLFSDVVRLNNRTQAESLLRREGLKRGNQTVANSLLSDLGVFGGQVRRSDPAVL